MANELIAQGTKVPEWQYLRRETGESAIFDFSVIADMTAHPYRLQCEQFRLTQLILDSLSVADIRFGSCVTGVTQTTDKVTVEYESDGTGHKMAGAFLIAADGGQSAVRKSLATPFTGKTYPLSSITIGVDHRFERDIPGLLNVNYVWTDTGSYSLMHLRDLWRCSYSPPPDDPEAGTEASIQAHLQTLFPSGKAYELVHINHYSIHQRTLHRFNHGRILFAGDAAHLNSPSGGLGMNSGIHDARCLVEHLVPVWRGESADLLDRYDQKCRTIAVEEVQRLSDQNYHRHRETDPAERERIWQGFMRIQSQRGLMREFLLKASLIDSLNRERAL